MVIAFQLFFCIIVIGSSFFGFGPFIATVIFSLLFTLGNVFTLPLLFLQSSVILGAGTIGFFIACLVTLGKASDSIDRYIARLNGALFIKGIIYSICLIMLVPRLGGLIGSFGIDGSILRWIKIMIYMYYIVRAPKKLAYYFQLESKRFIITIIVLVFMKCTYLLDNLIYLLFYYS